MIPVFDGHNDVLLRLWSKKAGNPVDAFLKGDGEGHIDVPRMIKGGMAGGFFAIFVPSPQEGDLPDDEEMNPPLAASVGQLNALNTTISMASLLFRIEQASEGKFKVCRTVAELRAAMAAGQIAAISISKEPTHRCGVEGAGRAAPGGLALARHRVEPQQRLWPWRAVPLSLDARYRAGTDGGGKALVKRCNELRIMIDLSHLNEQGFWDVAKLTNAPLVATHSNAHAICSVSRNLTDAQIRAVGQSGGMIGLNFANGFLRSDGRWQSENGLDSMMRHLDHLLKHAGEDSVGLGSDFDGARIPSQIGDVTGLQNLTAAMSAHGYGDPLMKKLTVENWMRVLERSWGE